LENVSKYLDKASQFIRTT